MVYEVLRRQIISICKCSPLLEKSNLQVLPEGEEEMILGLVIGFGFGFGLACFMAYSASKNVGLK